MMCWTWFEAPPSKTYMFGWVIVSRQLHFHINYLFVGNKLLKDWQHSHLSWTAIRRYSLVILVKYGCLGGISEMSFTPEMYFDQTAMGLPPVMAVFLTAKSFLGEKLDAPRSERFGVRSRKHVKPLVPTAFVVVSTHQSALGSRGGFHPFSTCVIHKEGLCPSSKDINSCQIQWKLCFMFGNQDLN
jgi:hypothetical protein